MQTKYEPTSFKVLGTKAVRDFKLETRETLQTGKKHLIVRHPVKRVAKAALKMLQDRHSLSNQQISGIFEDKRGNFWLLVANVTESDVKQVERFLEIFDTLLVAVYEQV